LPCALLRLEELSLKTKAVAAVAVAACLFAGPAAAEDLVFMLDSQSSEAVTEFYVSALQSDSWEEDILGADVLPSGEMAEITIIGANDACEGSPHRL
jgi:hypothetical protein